MELYAKGQLSFLILTCMQERDFYGLDIISEISKKSNGRINLKKPSVYSNLTRMEKQGYISSYLQSSDFGPNRKYYSLTENGRNFYKDLKAYFDRNNIDVFRDFSDTESPSPAIQNLVEDNVKENSDINEVDSNSQSETSSDEDFFDFSSIDNDNPAEEISIKQSTLLEDTQSIANSNNTEEITTNDYKFIENKVVDSEILSKTLQNSVQNPVSIKSALFNAENNKQDIDEYNKRLYDISKDINKYKRKRSFAEDQIAMTATAPLDDSQEKTKANIEDFKNSILENKNKNQGERISNLDFSRYTNSNRTLIQENEKKEEPKNDAVFITQRIKSDEIARPKRIEPPKLKISQIEAPKETKLPAPKRDLAIDPSHKEILSKLYSKTQDSSNAEIREDALYDFNDLKKYYNDQNITFDEYKKPAEKIKHNTNKLYLCVSLISFILASALSGVLFAILSACGLLNINTNFLYIVLPLLLVFDIIIKVYNHVKYKAWLPSQMLPQWQIWVLFLVTTGVTVSLNFICGMNTNNFELFASTTILPIVLSVVVLPLRYYIKRFLIVKFWK